MAQLELDFGLGSQDRFFRPVGEPTATGRQPCQAMFIRIRAAQRRTGQRSATPSNGQVVTRGQGSGVQIPPSPIGRRIHWLRSSARLACRALRASANRTERGGLSRANRPAGPALRRHHGRRPARPAIPDSAAGAGGGTAGTARPAPSLIRLPRDRQVSPKGTADEHAASGGLARQLAEYARQMPAPVAGRPGAGRRPGGRAYHCGRSARGRGERSRQRDRAVLAKYLGLDAVGGPG